MIRLHIDAISPLNLNEIHADKMRFIAFKDLLN